VVRNTPWKELGLHGSPFTSPNDKGEARGTAAADFIRHFPIGYEIVTDWDWLLDPMEASSQIPDPFQIFLG
jgi:hypothetical protein